MYAAVRQLPRLTVEILRAHEDQLPEGAIDEFVEWLKVEQNFWKVAPHSMKWRHPTETVERIDCCGNKLPQIYILCPTTGIQKLERSVEFSDGGVTMECGCFACPFCKKCEGEGELPDMKTGNCVLQQEYLLCEACRGTGVV